MGQGSAFGHPGSPVEKQSDSDSDYTWFIAPEVPDSFSQQGQERESDI